MSGTRLTRKVTVEGSKKLPEGGGQSSSSSSGTRRSVFDRLGPGTSEARPRPRESYPPEKCRNWLRDGRCQFGRNCKFLHGPFSEPKQRTKSIRSIVRSDIDRSDERDEGGMGARTRSLDSLDGEDEEEREIPVKKKKHRPIEESADTGKKSEKLKRRQHVEKASSEDDVQGEDDSRKRKRKLKKRQLSGGVVITKPRSSEPEERDWEDEEYDEGRGDLDWEERGELDYERQLSLEKRRQDLQRQLALMDEEDAAREVAERKVKETKKEREEEHKPIIPVVHSKLHPEKSSVSPGDEFSPVSSQSTPKKKKKKTDGETKKLKTKHKLSPSAKEPKKRKSSKPAAEGFEAGAVDERTRKITELSPEASKLTTARVQQAMEVGDEEKPRGIKKKQVKSKLKESHILKSAEDTYTIPLDVSGHGPQRSPTPEEIPRDKRAFSPEEHRPPVEKMRRRTALSSPEGSDSPALQYPREDRNRRVTDSSDGSPRKSLRDVPVVGHPGEAEYRMKAKGYDKRYRVEESPSTPEHGRRTVGKDPRHTEEGRAERRKNIVEEHPPHSPSPEDIPPRGPVTPPDEQRRHRSPPRGDKRGPQTPPGEPEFDNDAPKHSSSDRGPPRRRGPYTPPPPITPPVRSRVEKNREEFYEGRPEAVPYRDDLPRSKERGERETRYPKQRIEEGGDEPSRSGRVHPPIMDEEFPRSRVRDEEVNRGRHREDRQEDYPQRGRTKDERGDDFHRVRDREPERSDNHYRNRLEDARGDEFQRRKPELGDEILRRRDERVDDHLRARNREPEKDDERQRRRDERHDEHPRARVRDEHDGELQRSRGREIPRRQFEGGEERHWETPRGDSDSREVQFGERDRRRPDIPRQDLPDNRSRERPGERPRDREGRHLPPGPDYHRRGTSPTPQGPRRSPPPHGPPRGPHRFIERRRSLSPGGRREEGYRPGLPRDQGGYNMGRESVPGRGGYTAPFDNRGRPMESRRRNSPPPRPYAERGRGVSRGRGGRGGRGFPDRMRPPGDRYQEPPRDRGAPWDPERRREREHPRDRSRPHDESRDKERRTRGELSSTGSGPKHWEERRGGSPGRGSSPPRERRTHEQDKIPRDVEEDRRRRSDDEEDEWEYEEDIAEEKDRVPRHGERKRPRETGSSVSATESPVGGKRRRSETPETEEVALHDVPEGGKDGEQDDSTSTGIPEKQATKIKKKKTGKKVTKPEAEVSLEGQGVQETTPETEGLLEGEKQVKGEKKHKKEKGKIKDKTTKKKKKSSTTSTEEPEVAKELIEQPTNIPDEGGAIPSENLAEVAQPSDDEPISKAKKRRHVDGSELEEAKMKGSDKPPKKKKKKKHQPEVVVQPWADLEGEEEETNVSKSEDIERPEGDGQFVQNEEFNELKSTDGVTDENHDSSKVDEPIAVFSDWSDDSRIGDDDWSDINEPPEISEVKPNVVEKEHESVTSPVQNSVPAYDDVYDPISDDELDAMLGDEDEESRLGASGVTGVTSVPMAVEDVDWSALVSAQNVVEKPGEEPGSHLKRFTPGHVFSRIGISSSLAGPRLTKLVQQACANATNDDPSGLETVESSDVEATGESQVVNSIGALMAGAAAKRRERERLFTNVGPCRRALCARTDLAMRKRLRRLTGKVGLFQTPPSAPVDNELYLMSVALYKHEHSSTDSSVTKLIPSRVGTVLTTVTS